MNLISQNIKKIRTATLLTFLFFPSLLFAQSVGGGRRGGPGIDNPLGDDTTLAGFFAQILDIVITFAVPIVIFFIVYAGFLYVTAQGDPERIKRATGAFTWAVIGGVLILGANVLVDVIQGTVDSFEN